VSFQPVEAVFFWRYIGANFCSIYGRLDEGSYTKDYLQCRTELRERLDRALGRKDGEEVQVEYRWPGGWRKGEFRKAANDPRGQLSWLPKGQAPAPWKVGDPSADAVIAIPGDPNKATKLEADAELQKLRDSGLDPWVVAVKLRGEDRILHVRAYLTNPPANLEHKSVLQLPTVVRQAMENVPAGSGGGVDSRDFAGMRAPKLLRRILEAHERDPNVLLVGPPGTGKTVAMEDMLALYQGKGSAVAFDPDRWDNTWTEAVIPEASERKAVSLVFHPSYSYEDFVAGLVPEPESNTFRLVARPGPLLSLAHWAMAKDREALLLLDEFNRGPAAAIFGDTLALLDKDKRFVPDSGQEGAAIQRPYPRAEMNVAEEYASDKSREDAVRVASEVRLPASVRILAALNSSDRSVAPLDAALRRRFAILYVGPDYGVLADRLGTECPEEKQAAIFDTPADPSDWSRDHVMQLAVRLLMVLNQRIGFVLGQDFVLGHALLWGVAGETREAAAATLAKAFNERIAATLRLTFLDQDEALGAILGAGPPPTSAPAPSAATAVARWLFPPPALQGVATARLQVSDLNPLDWQASIRALRSLF